MSQVQGNELTFESYLHHHLSYWTIGEEGSFWRVNVDSLIMSFGIAFLLGLFLWLQARKASAGVPTKFQVVVEMFVVWIEGTAKGFIHNEAKIFAPLIGVTFLWILAMNLIDFVPVDWIPIVAEAITGEPHQVFHALPTADANVTFGIDLGIFIFVIGSGFYTKGLGYYKNFTSHPIPSPWAMPFNLFLEVVGFLSEFVSLSLRLFGNMFAGEVVYVLIAALFSTGILFALLAFPVHFLWSLLHILVVCLQAYIFTMLATVYISKSWNDPEH